MEQKICTKPAKTLPWYFLGLISMGTVSWGFARVYESLLAGRGASGWMGMAGATVFLVLAILAHIGGRKHGTVCYILSYGLNLTAAGFSAGTYYACSGMVPSAAELAPGFLWATAAGTLVCAGMCCPGKRWQSWCLLFSLLAALGLIGYSIYCWVVNPAAGSFQTFCAFAFLFFLIACVGNRASVENGDRPAYPLSIAGFGAFGLVTLVVILVLSEGEILEGVGDFFADLLPEGKKKKP